MPGPNLNDQGQRIVQEYRDAEQPWPATSRQVAAWAIDTGRWRPQPGFIVTQCADYLARAMREEYYTDPQGRPVRAKLAARFDTEEQQGTFWDDSRTATRDFAETQFQQRRQQIVGDCHQLRLDVDSFNENRNPTTPIQLELDFTADVEELEALRLLELPV